MAHTTAGDSKVVNDDESEEMENEVQEVSPPDSTSEVNEVSAPNRRWLWIGGIVLTIGTLITFLPNQKKVMA